MDLYLGIASLTATEFGIITCMYTTQAGYKYGFAGATLGLLLALVMVIGSLLRPKSTNGHVKHSDVG